MKKKSLIFIAVIIIGIILIVFNNYLKNKKDYYQEVSDIIVGFYNSEKFDESFIHQDDLDAVKAYLSTLTHENEEICVSDFVIKESNYKTNEKNSKNIFLKDDGKCYTYFENLKISYIKENEDVEMEPFDVLYCNGYEVILYRSYFKPNYKDTINNQRYNYVYIDSKESDNKKEFNYTSLYDGTKITVEMKLKDKKIEKISVIDKEI